MVREALAGNSPGVERALEEALKVFRELGLSVREVSWPSLPQALAAYYILAPAEASSNLARYDGTLYGRRAAGEEVEGMMEATRALFGLRVKRRVLVGTFVLSSGYYEAYYGRAQAFRRRLKAEAQALFREVDLLLLPTTPHPAFPFGARRDPLAMYREDLYTVGANLTGLPALSFPAGFEGHLPVGLQLLAPWGEDERLLRAALAFEEATARAHLKAPLGRPSDGGRLPLPHGHPARPQAQGGRAPPSPPCPGGGLGASRPRGAGGAAPSGREVPPGGGGGALGVALPLSPGGGGGGGPGPGDHGACPGPGRGD